VTTHTVRKDSHICARLGSAETLSCRVELICPVVKSFHQFKLHQTPGCLSLFKHEQSPACAGVHVQAYMHSVSIDTQESACTHTYYRCDQAVCTLDFICAVGKLHLEPLNLCIFVGTEKKSLWAALG
jgi:hypothetical protein